jgi:hypothetical protein
MRRKRDFGLIGASHPQSSELLMDKDAAVSLVAGAVEPSAVAGD